MSTDTEFRRAPHVATAAVVEALGHPSARRLLELWREYNDRHFGGELGAPLILITPPPSPRTLADYCGRDVHGLESRIRIAPHVVARGERFAADVLLHEMVHQWAEEIAEEPENGYRGHGPRFAGKCNAIGETLGLPRVAPKGRGAPDCSAWPICVRPAGYHPADERKPRNQAPSEAEERDDDGEEGRDDPRGEQREDEREPVSAANVWVGALVHSVRSIVGDRRFDLSIAVDSDGRIRWNAEVGDWFPVSTATPAALLDELERFAHHHCRPNRNLTLCEVCGAPFVHPAQERLPIGGS